MSAETTTRAVSHAHMGIARTSVRAGAWPRTTRSLAKTDLAHRGPDLPRVRDADFGCSPCDLADDLLAHRSATRGLLDNRPAGRAVN